jgi:serine/threonine protein kinase
VRILKSISHPNIVHLREIVAGNSIDSFYLVFEYVEHDLGDLVDSIRRPFTEPEVKCLLLQLLSAVAYLHDEGIMHRDLKVSNLLYNNYGELKLCDFGLSRYVEDIEIVLEIECQLCSSRLQSR